MLPDALAWTIGMGCWLLGMNALAILAFHHDKRMAQQRGWRVSERTLIAVSLLGGSLGALWARRRFRHKTRKQPFSAALYAVCALQVVTMVWLVVNGPAVPPAAIRAVGALTSR